MNNRERILEMLRNSPDRTVTCRQLAGEFLYHRAAARVNELNNSGFKIKFIPGPKTMDGRYWLEYDRDYGQSIKYEFDERGQMQIVI